ncbi:thioesterase family protein [Amycolatopsis sp. K13G38]|uniref:Thioesterase family protein n=1 Tax=Amycolatopsis acididurans TaxID=2724524 RepID=A0ABX1IYI8_9PSEU|nr:thioesterase family protein [Amycolatopsis acididurans]NKQ52566.1 thioesterase family protein [Amycolatopsis acididurans]
MTRESPRSRTGGVRELPPAFYLPLGEDRFQPTEHTSGPWSPEAQHFGPPSALLVRALEALPSSWPNVLARVTIEILGPAPLTELTVRSRVERPGRSVELLSAELAAGPRAVARASAWRITTTDTHEIASAAAPPWPEPDECPPSRWPEGWFGGYLSAMEWRTVSGDIVEPGAAGVWARQRVALVDGEEPSALQRLFTVADSGNGISNSLDPGQWWFINSELTVHVHRPPVSDWIGLDAATVIGPHGVGTATSTLRDLAGPMGTGAQALMVRTR